MSFVLVVTCTRWIGREYIFTDNVKTRRARTFANREYAEEYLAKNVTKNFAKKMRIEKLEDVSHLPVEI